ncbi:Fe2OG dioxygenase domain-containing protein [Durusdinium trenchii]|uniref:Fe2OG dioxygenase domain-containing protein n=1 Tax=Durusdinium trenchii TaxID=1381693 RepID=A0ABP0IS09_9DINO
MRLARVIRGMAKKDLFFCAAREHGQERPDLPLWGLRPEVSPETAFPLHSSMPSVRLQEVKGLKGGFQILDLMNADECEAFVDVLETLGFHTDAAVSLPYSFRHMTNCNLCVPEFVDETLFRRCEHLLPSIAGCRPLGLNAKFRCYRYQKGDYFKPHTDGSWDGSRITSKGFQSDAYGDRHSQLTFLILLTEDYEGGCTRFLVGEDDKDHVAVRTPKGGVLCFPHGYHPDSPLHEGAEIHSGVKYIVRTEVLYPMEAMKIAILRF